MDGPKVSPLFATRIFRRMFLSLFLVAALFFLGTILVVALRTRGALIERQYEVSSVYREQVARHIGDWIDERRSDVAVLARTLEIESEYGVEKESGRESLLAFTGTDGHFSSAFVVGPDGYGNIGSSVVSGPPIFAGDRPWVKAAFAGSISIGGYFKGRRSSVPNFAIAAPIRGPKGVAAVVVANLPLAEVAKIVEDATPRSIGAAYLTDSNRNLVSSPDFIRTYSDQGSAAAGPTLDTLGARSVAAKGRGTAAYLDQNRREVIGSWQWIAGLELGLVIELRADVALAPVTRLLEFTTALAFAMILLLVGIAWLLSSRLLQPIAALIQGADTVMKGGLPDPISLHTGTELDVLVGLFNRMARAVHLREEELRESAARDSLTGLLNHASLEEHLGREFEERRTRREPVTFVMIDIDHFKKVNDVHGHQAGDEVLRGVSAILRKSVRGGDVLGRYGGEEFAIIVDAASADETRAFCERVRKSVEAASFTFEGRVLRVTVSIGWARLPARRILPYDVVHQADKALYEAKTAGRNAVRGSEDVDAAAAG